MHKLGNRSYPYKIQRKCGVENRSGSVVIGRVCAMMLAAQGKGPAKGSINMTKELSAEFVGTFTLVTAVCGAALFSAPSAGLIAVAFAVGLSVLAMAYAVGPLSGGHFNPAVTCGLVAAGRFDAGKAIPYIIAQVIGGVGGAAGLSV